MTTKPRRPGAPSRPAKDLPPFGRELRAIRGALSMSDAAAKCGRSGDWWYGKETGRIAVSIDELKAIASGFGVSWRTDGDGTRVIRHTSPPKLSRNGPT